MKKIRLFLGERSYEIMIGDGLLRKAGGLVNKLGIGKDAVIVTNRTLERIYRRILVRSFAAAGISSHFEFVPDSEKAKSFRVLERLVSRIGAHDSNKGLFIVAFGGGVIGDLAGFAAAIYKRGVPYVQIPTTLLAQVDSAIGGKVAVDLPIAKNLVGAFYQPRAVISDTRLIATLPERQLKSGLAEIIKYGVIKDPLLFRYIEENLARIIAGEAGSLEFVISRASAIKARIVEKDEFDRTGLRAILNYGHTIGHAIEAASGYSRRYTHGEAVAIGMVAASRISGRLGFLKRGMAERIEGLVAASGLPTRARSIRASRVFNAHLHDKKFIRGRNRFVLPTGIGTVKIMEGVPARIIKEVMQECLT